MEFGFMNDSVGKLIQIERGGPDKIAGKLLGLQKDHLILHTQEGAVVYVNTNHVKTISEPIITEAEEAADPNAVQVPVPAPTVLEAGDFLGLINALQHKLVKINQNGPNSLEGVLLTVRDDSVTLVHKMKEYVHFPLYHIKTITWIQNAPKQEQKKDEKKEGENKKDGENKKENENKK